MDFLIDQCDKFNKTYFTYSGEVVMMKNCCNGFQEKNSMYIGKEIYLAIVVIFYFVQLRIVIFIDISVLSR